MKCKDLNAGKLRTAVTFERATRTSDGAGGYTEAWATITGAPTRAAVKHFTGRETMDADRIEFVSRTRLFTRYNSGLKQGDRVTMGSKVYNIQSVIDIEMRGKYLQIDLKQGVAV